MNRFYVVTGGPGAGKSTLIAALNAGGYAAMPESGRDVIRTQVAAGGTALPWADRAAFAALMFAKDVANYRNAEASGGIVMFDRGLPDTVGYLTHCGLAVPDEIAATAASMRYNTTVFIAPPWREIFDNDAERKQDFAEAQATFTVMQNTYTALGYQLVELPRAPVAARVAFIHDRLVAG